MGINHQFNGRQSEREVSNVRGQLLASSLGISFHEIGSTDDVNSTKRMHTFLWMCVVYVGDTSQHYGGHPPALWGTPHSIMGDTPQDYGGHLTALWETPPSIMGDTSQHYGETPPSIISVCRLHMSTYFYFEVWQLLTVNCLVLHTCTYVYTSAILPMQAFETLAAAILLKVMITCTNIYNILHERLTNHLYLHLYLSFSQFFFPAPESFLWDRHE